MKQKRFKPKRLMRYPERKKRYGDFVRRSLEPQERKRLIQLQKDLLKLGEFPTGNVKKIILFNIKFFDIISTFQDEGYLRYQPEEKKDIADFFNLSIKKSGRQENPEMWNSTKKGEKITSQNVVYGGVFGLPIKPALYWLNLPKNRTVCIDVHPSAAINPKNSPAVITKNIWQTEAIVNFGIAKFTSNNLKVILRCLDKLLSD